MDVAHSDERIDVIKKQAEAQASHYKKLLDEVEKKDKSLQHLSTKLEALQDQLKKCEKEMINSEAIKKQAEGLHKEYSSPVLIKY
jgi:uncharacterized coiled-coil DUF342 family protein